MSGITSPLALFVYLKTSKATNLMLGKLLGYFCRGKVAGGLASLPVQWIETITRNAVKESEMHGKG